MQPRYRFSHEYRLVLQNLPPLYINVILYIAQFPQFSKNQRDVEHFLDLSNPTVTKLLKSMEKKDGYFRNSTNLILEKN